MTKKCSSRLKWNHTQNINSVYIHGDPETRPRGLKPSFHKSVCHKTAVPRVLPVTVCRIQEKLGSRKHFAVPKLYTCRWSHTRQHRRHDSRSVTALSPWNIIWHARFNNNLRNIIDNIIDNCLVFFHLNSWKNGLPFGVSSLATLAPQTFLLLLLHVCVNSLHKLVLHSLDATFIHVRTTRQVRQPSHSLTHSRTHSVCQFPKAKMLLVSIRDQL